MKAKDISFRSPQDNLLYDEVLLEMAEEGRIDEALRFWEAGSFFVVMGLASDKEKDVNLNAVERDNIPVLRRRSGGGTVLQGPGCLNYSLILRKDRAPALADIRKSYRYILNDVLQVLKACGVDAAYFPTSDLALSPSQMKFSGNAQRRRKHTILHHGTFLLSFDLKKISDYLLLPEDMPDYRKGRPHGKFVTNVPVNREDIKNAFRSFFGTGRFDSAVTDEENAVMKELRKKICFI